MLIQKAVKTTKKVFYDKKLVEGFPNADEVIKDFLFVTRRRSSLEESKGCRSMIIFICVT